MWKESLLILLQITAVVQSFAFPRNSRACNSSNTLKIDDNHYLLSRVVDLGDDSTPSNAQYDDYGNLFFVLMRFKNGRLLFDAHILKSNTHMPEKIEGLPDGSCYCIAFDNTYYDVYFGTGAGIFRYDYTWSQATRDSGPSIQPNMLAIDKDGNKFISEKNNGVEELFVLEGERKLPYNSIKDFDVISIDNKNSIYYLQGNKIFSLKSDQITPSYIAEVPYGRIAQINFYKDVVYVASKAVLYFHKNGINKLKRIENSPHNVVAISFDTQGRFLSLGSRGKLFLYEKYDCGPYSRLL